MSNKKEIFELINLTPIGFKSICYPVHFCSICRGYLSDVCSSCIEIGNDKCNIVDINGFYYHYHCYSLMKSNENNDKT